MGLLLGIELVRGAEAGEGTGRVPWAEGAVRVAEAALAEGLLVLPAGEEGHVVEMAPPACLTHVQVDAAVEILARVVRQVTGAGTSG